MYSKLVQSFEAFMIHWLVTQCKKCSQIHQLSERSRVNETQERPRGRERERGREKERERGNLIQRNMYKSQRNYCYFFFLKAWSNRVNWVWILQNNHSWCLLKAWTKKCKLSFNFANIFSFKGEVHPGISLHELDRWRYRPNIVHCGAIITLLEPTSLILGLVPSIPKSNLSCPPPWQS